MILYATENKNYFPSDLGLTLPYLRQANHTLAETNGFEILYRGSLNNFCNSPSIASRRIVLRSAPWQGQDGKWARIYGFADGHCETTISPIGKSFTLPLQIGSSKNRFHLIQVPFQA